MAGKGDRAELKQLLSSYIDGACSREERDRVQEALQHDPEFRALYTQLVRTIEAVGAMPSEAAPSHVRERILSKLERRALLGVASVAAPPPPAQVRERNRSTGWLGLLAAAMLVAGVGATWWIRMHEEKAPSQLAMAPVPPSRGDHVIVRKTAPQETNEGMQGLAALDRATDEAGRQYRSKVAQPAQSPLSPPPQASPPAAEAPASPPPQVVSPAAPVLPQAPMMADRAVHDVARSESAVRPALDHELAMRERDGATGAGKPEAMQPLGRAATETIAAAPMAEAAPSPEAKNVPLAPGSPSEALRLAGEGGRFGQAASTGALAAASPGKDTSDLPTNEAAPETAMMAYAAKRQPVAVPMAGLPLNAVARARPAGPAGLYGLGGKLKEAPEPAVTQLQVSVRDVGRQMVLTSEVIRSRVGGQRMSPADPSVIVAAEPAARVPWLAEMVGQAPGVVGVRSDVLPASDPLASQAMSLAAEQQWLYAARSMVEWAASGQADETTLQFSPGSYCTFQNVPRVVPQEYAVLVIVLQPVAPAASEPSSQ